MIDSFAFFLAPEFAEFQDVLPKSDWRNITASDFEKLLSAEGAYWGNGTVGGRLFFAHEVEGRIRPIVPELTIHFCEGHGFQFFLGGRNNNGKSCICINDSASNLISSVGLDMQTEYFLPSNAFFLRPDAIKIVQEYFQYRGDIGKSAFKWLCIQDKDAEYENPHFWVDQARQFAQQQ